MSKLMVWFRAYNTEITWFIIGMLTNNAVMHLSLGQYESAIVDMVLAGVNYYFWKARG